MRSSVILLSLREMPILHSSVTSKRETFTFVALPESPAPSSCASGAATASGSCGSSTCSPVSARRRPPTLGREEVTHGYYREMAAAEGMEIPAGAEYFPVMSTT